MNSGIFQTQLRILQKEETKCIRNHDAKKEELTKKYEHLSKASLTAKRALSKDISADERKLAFLTSTSSKVVKELESRVTKGKQILTLIEICKKYETEDDLPIKWPPEDDSLLQITGKELVPYQAPEEAKLPALELQIRSMEETKGFELSSDQIEKDIEALQNIEGFWDRFNKAGVDLLELRQERAMFLDENRRMKEVMRKVLENAVLHGDNFTCRTKGRVVKSAPR